jgi:plastocyanin
MKGKSFWVLGATVALAAGIISCGGGSQPAETPAAPAAGAPAAGGGKTVDAATAGSISGMIMFDGTAPKMRPINMAAEPSCAKIHTTPATTEDVVVGGGGSLQNVVVYLKGDFSQYSLPPASTPATLDQKGCQYTPHVVALQVGQALNVTNSDMTTHNIHPVPANNREWNQSQPPGSAPLNETFAREEIAVPVKCNVHPWMKSYIAVVGNPYFQVTGADGKFMLKNVPPGTYTLTAWHESLGAMDQMVTVGASENKADIHIAFKPKGAGAD